MTPIQKARNQMRGGYLLAAVLWLSLLVTEWSHHDRLATDHMLRLLPAFGLVLACWLLAERDNEGGQAMTRETAFSCDWCDEPHYGAQNEKELRDDFGWIILRVAGHRNLHLCGCCAKRPIHAESLRKWAMEGRP